jgi:hypothetical protein
MKIYDITGIGANLTGSFSGSFKEIFTGTATTASYVQYSNVADKPTLISGSSQIADFGYATTGSNQFDGSQAITGSLTVTGQVVAQTLNVQQVTSSIVYSSGSNIFGNDLGNTQQFTGSVSVTGSLTVVTAGTELQVTSTGVNLGNALTDSHIISGSLTVNPNGLFVSGSGNVGIGTTSPTLALSVIGQVRAGYATDAGVTIGLTPVGIPNNDLSAYILWGDNATFGGENGDLIYVPRTSTTGAHRFYTGAFGVASEKMRITSGGNVGVGVDNPGARLHVTGTVEANGSLYRAIFGGTSAQDADMTGLTGGNGSEVQIQAPSITRGAYLTLGGGMNFGEAMGGIAFYNSNNVDGKRNRAFIVGAQEGATAGEQGSYLSFGTVANAGTVPSERMRITSGGDLSFKGRSTTTNYDAVFYNDNSQFAINANNTNVGKTINFNHRNDITAMTITSGGNVGIGIDDPSRKFQVREAGTSTSGDVVAIRNDNATSGAFINFIAGGTNAPSMGAKINDLVFTADGYASTELMRIKSNGNVIIGPSSVVDLGSIMTIDGNVNLTNGANRLIYIGSRTNYNYQLRTDDDDFAIREAGTTDRLRYSYTNVRWDITGGLVVSGALSKGSGSFRIDHPLPSKKDTHHLVHSFIEGPQADNIYRGKIQLVNGKATVNLDQSARMTEGTFVLLNGNTQCFTSNESGWTAVKGIVAGNILTIEAQDQECTDTISWLVIGERIDQHMLDTDWTDENGKVIVEPLKTE